MNDVTQQVIEVDLPPEHSICLGGDDHYGGVTCEEQAIRDRHTWVNRSKNRFMIHMGDLCENITPKDRRYNPDVHDMSVSEQYRGIREHLERVADDTLVCLSGNHDWKNQGRDGDIVRDHVCAPLGIPYGTNECKVSVYVDGDLAYKMYLNHGFSSMNSRAKHSALEKRNYYRRRLYQILRSVEVNDCEVMALGHHHRLLAFRPRPFVRLYDDGDELQDSWSRLPNVKTEDGERWIHPDNRWYACTGTTRKSREQGVITYPSTKGYPPTPLGWCVLDYDHGKESLNIDPVLWQP